MAKGWTGSAVAAVLIACVGCCCFAQSSPPVIQSTARLVVLDVVVTDAHGLAVPGLTLQDFAVRENGSPQVLKTLEDHTGPHNTSSSASAASSEAPLPKGTYSNRPPAQIGVWNVLVFDTLNTDRVDQARARQELLRFAKTLNPGAPVALIVVSASSAKMLVPFTESGAAIVDVLSGKQVRPVNSPLLDRFEPIGAQESELGRMDMRVNQTLRYLDGMAAWLAHLPGKKNLYWLSSGFPITAEDTTYRDYDDPGASAVYKRNYLRLQQETDKRLESARVAVFPIDVRGNSGAMRDGIDSADMNDWDVTWGIATQDRMSQYDRRVNESQAGMMEIADATGGTATTNRNNIAEILSDQFQQAEKFYTLSYSPQNSNWNGEYRKIDLALAKRGYKLYYRHGYYALDAAPQPTQPAAAASNTVDAFSLAMRHGARPSSAVLFTTRMDHTSDGQLSLASKIDQRTVSLASIEDGRQLASVDCAVVEYDEAGKVLGTAQIHSETRLGLLDVQHSTEVPVQQKVPLVAGARWLTVGIRDHASGKFGTLQIPLDLQ